MNAKSCAFCASTGYNQQLPRMRPTWWGWTNTESEVRQGGLQMFIDDGEVYVVCNDCQVGHAFVQWVQTGIWVPPHN
jgi:hypothetical protein